MFRHALIAVALATTVLAAPALAEDGPGADMGYAFEFQAWNVPTTTGQMGFGALMHTLTLTDRTGTVLALATSTMRTNANRYYAEQDAIRRRENFYTYQQVIDEPKEGVRLGLVLGTGSPTGLSPAALAAASDLDAKLVRLRFETDLTELFGGTLGFHTGGGYFRAAGTGTAGFELSSWQLPIGLCWRIAPLPVRGLVFEPFADLDWGNAISRGFKSMPARNLGLRVAYYPHPALAFTARAEAAAQPIDGSLSLVPSTLADVKLGAVGAQLLF